ncbi:MAG TPA: malto-oligosyltrehalose synthase [Steroidobacteraceae bacterium]|nr:malto-oligosyltrehalose synthase [Steroidobacteraceae bacterium]
MDEPRASALIPRATYRVQLNAGFTFKDATALIPYLAELGISHVYCSPYFRARPGSVHGYDVVDHNSLNPEIGTRRDFDEFVAALRSHHMGHILDFVPNHVGIMGADNAWWMDVLENGKASRFADFFDIDWSPPNPALADKLLVPALGEPYGTVLENGELKLQYEEDLGSFAVFYHQHRFPIDPRTYPVVIERALSQFGSPIPGMRELESLSAAFRNLPDRETSTPEQVVERDRDEEIHKQRLMELLDATPELHSAMETAALELSGTPGNASSFDALHELLERQCYRLAYWRVAADDINYRRFFDVNDLAALRMENDAVFEATHRLVLELLREGKLDGLRIDHPDGLYDPAQYFKKLQQQAGLAIQEAASSLLTATGSHVVPPGLLRATAGSQERQAASQDVAASDCPLYLLVEKITASFERLPQTWPVHGTTGYNFTNVVNGVFVDSRAKTRLDRVYRTFIGDYLEWPDTAYDSKVLVLRTSLAAELNVLANQLARIAQTDRHTRDFTLTNLRQALTEVIAAFPVYRTYVTDVASEEDRRYIEWAIARARSRSPSTNIPLLDFVRSMLLADVSAVAEPFQAQVRSFARKFQQVTAPVTAKGVEDTALYRFTRLASLNEVGGEPENFGISARQFHGDAQNRARNWPHEMLTSSTHDTKRSENVRARMNVISEMTGVWRKSIQRWSRINRARRKIVDDFPAPGPHAEYLLYQTLLGTWPVAPASSSDDTQLHQVLKDDAYAAYRERIEEYMVKASREAKRRTSWANVNEEYENALRQFIRLSLERREGNPFPAEIEELARRTARFGSLNSLSQTLLKLTAPGMPDIYQGNEIWDWSLVDPDNRRPVDYASRQRLLEELKGWHADNLDERLHEALESIGDGRCKLHVTWTALQLRAVHEALFRDGSYVPLKVSGERATHVLAFARQQGGEVAVVAVPRLCLRLLGEKHRLPTGPEVWGDTRIEVPAKLASAPFRNTMNRRQVEVQAEGEERFFSAAAVFAEFPVALLISAASAA